MDQRYEAMRLAVLEGEEEAAEALAKEVLAEGMDIEEAMNQGFLVGIKEAGDLYEEGEYYLPELVCSADAMKTALAVLDQGLKKGDIAKEQNKKIMLVTVQGDVHDIGKTIVGAMMTASGFKIIDLGSDVPNEEVIQAVRNEKPHVLGLSALLTSTMEEQKNIIQMLESEGLRKDVKVIVGGAPVNQNWAKGIGADGYSDSAVSAVRLVEELLK